MPFTYNRQAIALLLLFAGLVSHTAAQTGTKQLVRPLPKKPAQADTTIQHGHDSTYTPRVNVSAPVRPGPPDDRQPPEEKIVKATAPDVSIFSPVLAVKTPVNKTSKQQGGVVLTDAPAPAAADSLEQAAYRDAMVSYYHYIKQQNVGSAAVYDSITAHNKWALHNQEQVITSQQSKGSVIFILVLVLVGSGLVFSAIQFYIALATVRKKHELTNKVAEGIAAQTANPSTEQNTVDDGPSLGAVTTIKASLQGVEISSSILGLLVLVISLAFFYLYLTRVYPIVTEKFVQTQEVAPQ